MAESNGSAEESQNSRRMDEKQGLTLLQKEQRIDIVALGQSPKNIREERAMSRTTWIPKLLSAAACCLWLASCGPSKPETPPLTEGTAIALLQENNKAKNWLEHVKKENASCDYKIDLPEQASHPTTIDVDHIVLCGGRPGPKALDASVSFAYDANAGHWVITRFLS